MFEYQTKNTKQKTVIAIDCINTLVLVWMKSVLYERRYTENEKYVKYISMKENKGKRQISFIIFFMLLQSESNSVWNNSLTDSHQKNWISWTNTVNKIYGPREYNFVTEKYNDKR